jgi:hypothetical protein
MKGTGNAQMMSHECIQRNLKTPYLERIGPFGADGREDKQQRPHRWTDAAFGFLLLLPVP